MGIKLKSYKPCKTRDDLIARYNDYILHINTGSDWKMFVDLVPVEIFGLDLKGKTGEFTFEDLEKYL